ncbi:hypothetical protein niasHT_037911 [Heterodera trifolii]|uniref:Integrase catalytic domain-containing protein n=1 Tax=Heterodera trifolii TaxID=157864 RepID=A0ABD2IQ15_9BILA
MVMVPESEYLALISLLKGSSGVAPPLADPLQGEKALLDAQIQKNLADPKRNAEIKMKRHSWLYKRRHQLKDIIENKPQKVIVESGSVTAPNVAPYMGIQKQQTPSHVSTPHRNSASIQSIGATVSKSNTDVEEDTDFSTASDQFEPAATDAAAALSRKKPHQKTPTIPLRTSPKNFPKMMGIIGKDLKKFGVNANSGEILTNFNKPVSGSHFTESLKHMTGQREDVPRGHRFFIQRISKNPEIMKLLQKTPQTGEGRRRSTQPPTVDKLLEQIYYDLRSPASYAGMLKVWEEAKRINPRISLNNVYDFLHRQRTYTLFKPRRNKFPRLKTVPSGLHTDWQCDLCIMDTLRAHNDGYRYILVCVDVLSRKIFTAESESKKSEHMIEAFEKVFKKAGVLPNKLYSDAGLEFQAKRMIEYWKQKDIIKHIMYSPSLHAGVVERANRTLKERLYKYFSENNTLRVQRVNNTDPHSYRIRDLNGEDIKGIFYDQELVKTTENGTHRAEVLKSRTRNGVKEHFVRWVGLLPHTLELDSKWSVALSAIIYPYSFPSISVDEDDSISVKLVNPNYREDAGNSDEESQKFINLSVKIPNVQFQSVQSLQKTLNQIIQNAYDTKFGGSSSLNDGTPNKRAKRQTELSETGAGVIEVENFFTRNPFDYWQQIGELRKKHYQLRERVEKMTKEYNSTKDGERKTFLSTELGIFQGRETFLKEHLHLIEEEAKRRDGEQQEANEQRLIDRFFARYPDNYREQLDEWRSSYLRDVLDLQTKMGEYEGVKDLKRLKELNSQTERMRNSLHVFGRKMEILNNAALQRDQKRSQEEFERLSHEQNLSFVQEFFQANPVNYWQAIQKNYEALQFEYTKKRELREKFEFETDATERESLQRQIESIQRLIDYRHKRFAALEYEAKKIDTQKGKDNSGLNAVAEGSSRTNTTPTDSFSPDEPANPDEENATNSKNNHQQNITTTATATSETPTEQILADQGNSIADKHEAGTPPSIGLEQSGDVATSMTHVEEGGNLPQAAALISNDPKIVAKQSTVATERRKEKIIEKLMDEQVDRMVDGTHAQQKMLQEEGKDNESQHRISTYKLIEEVLHGEHGQLMSQQRESKMAAELAYNEITQRFGIRMGPGVMHVDLSKQLSYVLGFDHKTRIYNNQSAKYPPDLSGGVRQLYVYAPKLVEDSIIGDRMAPLLRVVNVSGTPGLDMPELKKTIVMTHVVFNPDNVNWSAFLALQQQQEGNGELQYFVGSKFQRGGGLLQNISRFLMPVATNLLKSASKEGISAGTRMLDDLAQGKAFKESLKTQAKQGFENLAEKLNQCGKGGRQRHKTITHRKNKKTGTLRGKRQIIDQLTLAH